MTETIPHEDCNIESRQQAHGDNRRFLPSVLTSDNQAQHLNPYSSRGMAAGDESPSGASKNNLKETKRSRKTWHDDGDFVISAKAAAAPETILFKVHKIVLKSWSPVWRDMLSMSQPPQGQEMYDGDPLVEFHDTAEDLGFFFQLMYGQR